jgi:hypothetical protein
LVRSVEDCTFNNGGLLCDCTFSGTSRNYGTECDWFSAILGLQLFAEHGYAAELSEQKLRKRFTFCTGGRFDDFMDIRWMDEIPGIEQDNLKNANPSRVMLWQHPMMGLFDSNLAGRGLEELEEARLPYHGKEGYLDCQWYQFIPTASRIAQP